MLHQKATINETRALHDVVQPDRHSALVDVAQLPPEQAQEGLEGLGEQLRLPDEGCLFAADELSIHRQPCP